jgi:hypothetical protein
MENIVVLNEEQFEDILYRTVSRCLDEKNIGSHVEKPEDEASMIVTRYVTYCISRILLSGVLSSLDILEKSRRVGRQRTSITKTSMYNLLIQSRDKLDEV